jgi:hypothetical protein
MAAYRKFGDTLKLQPSAPCPPKPPKAPKIDPIEAGTLGGLGALGGAEPQIQNSGPRADDHALATWGDPQVERAAIVEHDGKIPPAWAEGFARLDPRRPPADAPPHRWQRFVDDVGLFVDGPFCAVAILLGWGPFDLFGCDRDRPFARIDRAGLLWLLNGDKLVELTETTATIETKTGQRQRGHRKPIEPGRVLAWEFAP